MGAAASEVTAGTREILVESANFRGPRVRRMGVATGLRSEASSRHERSLPLELPDAGAWRAAALLSAQGAQAHVPFAVGVEPGIARRSPSPQRRSLRCSASRSTKRRLRSALTALGFAVRAAGDGLYVRPPYWRNDVAIAATSPRRSRASSATSASPPSCRPSPNSPSPAPTTGANATSQTRSPPAAIARR